MYCPNCGTQNPDDAAWCTNCLEPLPTQEAQTAQDQSGQSADGPAAGQSGAYNSPPYQQDPYHQPRQQPYQQAQGDYSYQQQPLPPKPSTFLAGNIVMTVLAACSCAGLVTGIIGIVFSAMVGSRYNAGDYEGSKKASTVAKILFFVTTALAVLAVIFIIFSVVAFLTGVSSGYFDYFNNLYDFYY